MRTTGRADTFTAHDWTAIAWKITSAPARRWIVLVTVCGLTGVLYGVSFHRSHEMRQQRGANIRMEIPSEMSSPQPPLMPWPDPTELRPDPSERIEV